MNKIIASFVRFAPSKALLLFVIFCGACLSSCAVGVSEEKVSTREDVASTKDEEAYVMNVNSVPLWSPMDAGWPTPTFADVPSTEITQAIDQLRPTPIMRTSLDAGRDTGLPIIIVDNDSGTPEIDSGRPVLDTGSGQSTDVRVQGACHALIITLDARRMPACETGWVIILYDAEGHPHESAPNTQLSFEMCGRLRGQLVVSARCRGNYLIDWPGRVGAVAREGGISSILLDGNELADAESLMCFDEWSPTPGIRPIIPLEPFFHGRCP